MRVNCKLCCPNLSWNWGQTGSCSRWNSSSFSLNLEKLIWGTWKLAFCEKSMPDGHLRRTFLFFCTGGAVALISHLVPALWAPPPPRGKILVAQNHCVLSPVFIASSAPRISFMARCWARAASGRPLRYRHGIRTAFCWGCNKDTFCTIPFTYKSSKQCKSSRLYKYDCVTKAKMFRQWYSFELHTKHLECGNWTM